MQDTHANPPALVGLRLRYRNRFDAAAMFVYLCIVYANSLYIHPLGRDYAALAERGASMPWLARGLFAWEMATFGDNPLGYHAVNLLFLYAGMLLVFFLVNHTVRGVWWMGTLAACLFMANPVHSEAVLNLCGAADLVPFLAAMLAITLYAAHAYDPVPWRLASSLLFFAAAVLAYPQNAYLFLVIALLEFVTTEPDNRNRKRLWPYFFITLAGFYVNSGAIGEAGFSPARAFQPLYFTFYPIGFLPETARRFHEHPALGWLAAATVLFVLWLIHRRARSRAFLFAFLAMAAVRLYPGTRPVDPVHLIGGGQLLLPAALFSAGLVALFYRIMGNPRWRVPMVGVTTVLVVILFIMQIRENAIWSGAGREVRDFQRTAAQAAKGQRVPIGVCPDYAYFLGAPVCLSESIRFDTPFSEALDAVSLLRLNRDRYNAMTVQVRNWSKKGGQVVVSGTTPLAVAPWPYTLSRMGDEVLTGGAKVYLTEAGQDGFTYRVEPHAGKPLPQVLVPPEDGSGEPGRRRPLVASATPLENPFPLDILSARP